MGINQRLAELSTKQLINDHLYQVIVESITSAVFIFQGEKLLYANSHAEILTGYTKKELLSMPFWAVIDKDLQQDVREKGFSSQAGENIPANYELKIAHKNGDTFWVNFRASMLEIDGEPAVLGIADDITEKKQADAAFQAIMESIAAELGQDYFNNIVIKLAKWLNVECVILGKLVNNEQVQTISMLADGEHV